MPLYPAFTDALERDDHTTLLNLYTTAMQQCDRAEAQIRALLSARTSSATIGEIQGGATDYVKRYPKLSDTPLVSKSQAKPKPTPAPIQDLDLESI